MAGQTDNSRRIRQLPRSPASVTNDERSEGTSLQNYPLTRFFVTRIFCKVFFTAPGWWEGKKTMLKFLFDTWLTFIISRQSWQQTRETAVETAGRERHDAWRHFIGFSITLICDVSGVMVSHWWILKRTRSTQFKLVPRCLKKTTLTSALQGNQCELMARCHLAVGLERTLSEIFACISKFCHSQAVRESQLNNLNVSGHWGSVEGSKLISWRSHNRATRA